MERNGYLVVHERTGCTFVAVSTWCVIDVTRSYYWCSKQYGAVCNSTLCVILLSEFTATSIMALYWFSLVECMERCCVGPGRTDCTFVAVPAWCVIDLTRSWYRCLMQYGAVCNFTSCVILLSKYTATLMMAFYWSSLVECMERVPCWPWTNRK